MRPELSEQSVIKASAQFWEQMLSMHLEPMHGDAGVCLDARHVRCDVALSGVWAGRVEVRLAERLAQEATAAMLMQTVESLADADTLDASREIANMIGGVLKSSLPRPCLMTLPSAVREAEEYRSTAESSDLIVVSFCHPAGHMVVRVWESEGEEVCAEKA